MSSPVGSAFALLRVMSMCLKEQQPWWEFICIRANESSFVNLLDWITTCFSFSCTHKEVVCSSLMPDRSFSWTLLPRPGHCMLVKVLGIIFLYTEKFLCTVKFSLYTVTRVATTLSALQNFGVQMPLQRFSLNLMFRWICFFIPNGTILKRNGINVSGLVVWRKQIQIQIQMDSNCILPLTSDEGSGFFKTFLLSCLRLKLYFEAEYQREVKILLKTGGRGRIEPKIISIYGKGCVHVCTQHVCVSHDW